MRVINTIAPIPISVAARHQISLVFVVLPDIFSFHISISPFFLDVKISLGPHCITPTLQLKYIPTAVVASTIKKVPASLKLSQTVEGSSFFKLSCHINSEGTVAEIALSKGGREVTGRSVFVHTFYHFSITQDDSFA